MSFSVQEILSWIPAQLVNPEALGDHLSSIRISHPAPLGISQASHLAFFFSKSVQDELVTAQPGVLITGQAFVPHLKAAQLPFWSKTAVLACEDPYLAMAQISEKFAEKFLSGAHTSAQLQKQGALIHPTAILDPSVEVGEGVQIGPYCFIQEKVKIGAHSVLYSGCQLAPNVSVGSECVLFPHVVLYESTAVGDRVRIHAGAVIGADGFGYAPIKTPQGMKGHQKIHHFGRVVVGSDVEIGANTTIDRGTFSDTMIADHVKIDNQVHIGHNVKVEEGAILCGCVGVSGSATIGKYSYIGGAVGISNQVKIGEGSLVGAMTLVTKNIPPQGKVAGNPQRNYREHFQVNAMLNKMIQERRSRSE